MAALSCIISDNAGLHFREWGKVEHVSSTTRQKGETSCVCIYLGILLGNKSVVVLFLKIVQNWPVWAFMYLLMLEFKLYISQNKASRPL